MIDRADAPGRPQKPATAAAHCNCCHAEKDFSFACDHVPPAGDPECINPTDSPSRIIDLGQWLSLHALMLEKAGSADSPAAAHRAGYQATLCLAEALKFYGDDELPDKSAFFSHASDLAFQEHPENFARQKLRDMQARLPALHRPRPRTNQKQGEKDRKWWQLWKRDHAGT